MTCFEHWYGDTAALRDKLLPPPLPRAHNK
jgi:hypothetical protein